MKDFADLAPRVTGTFPDVAAKDDTIPGDKTGTPLAAFWLTELMGAFQAILNHASLTPSGSSEADGASQILTALQTSFIDGLAGGTYSPSASLTWNAALIVDASAGPGTNVDAITATGKGTGNGGDFTGGATGVGITSHGGTGKSACSFHGGNGTTTAGNGGYFYGADASAGDGGDGGRFYGGDGSAYGGIGIFAYGGGGVTDDGPGAYLYGHSGTGTLTLAGQGAIIAGGDNGADALWAITHTGSEPGSARNDYAIWASTGGAFPATALTGSSSLGYGLIGISASGIGCALTATTTGSPLRIVPKSATPTTNVLEGCMYFDSDTHTLHYYDGSNWQQVAKV